METMPKVIGDILKHESDRRSRVTIEADNVKIGQLVMYPLRQQFLVALSNSENGKVLVQPHNCTINLDNVTAEALQIAGKNTDADADVEDNVTPSLEGDGSEGGITVEELVEQGDQYGIHYIGVPA